LVGVGGEPGGDGAGGEPGADEGVQVADGDAVGVGATAAGRSGWRRWGPRFRCAWRGPGRRSWRAARWSRLRGGRPRRTGSAGGGGAGGRVRGRVAARRA